MLHAEESTKLGSMQVTGSFIHRFPWFQILRKVASADAYRLRQTILENSEVTDVNLETALHES